MAALAVAANPPKPLRSCLALNVLVHAVQMRIQSLLFALPLTFLAACGPSESADLDSVDAESAVDGKADGKLSAIYVRDPDSRWRGPLDLKIGMSSTELDQLNGRPFRFLGFDWDYGGYVSNWAEGVLATALLAPGHLAVRLAPPALAEGEERAADYPAGDSEFPSDLPSVRAQPPVVVEFGVAFGP